MPTSDLADTSEWNPESRPAALNAANPTTSQFSQATRVDSGMEDTPLDSEFDLTSDSEGSSEVDADRLNRPDSNIGKILRFSQDGNDQLLKLTQLIGIGGMGKVYEAVSLDDPKSKTVAVKLAKKSRNVEKIQRRLVQESELLQSLNHKNIVRFVGAGTTDNESGFIVMERVFGLNVVEFVNRYQLSLENDLSCFPKFAQQSPIAMKTVFSIAISSQVMFWLTNSIPNPF